MTIDPFISANVRSKRNLKSLAEVEEAETSEFIRTTFTYIDEHDGVWFGQSPSKRTYDLTTDDLHRLLQRAPDDKVFPRQTSTISMVPDEMRSQCYIKRPKLLCFDDEAEAKVIPELLLGEAEGVQSLRQHPHPNVIKFHGCTVKQNRITGIALDKYDVMLQYRHEGIPHPLDVDACMRGIRTAPKHFTRQDSRTKT